MSYSPLAERYSYPTFIIRSDKTRGSVSAIPDKDLIVKTFANRVIEKQERKYAEEDAAESAAQAVVNEVVAEAISEERTKKAKK